MKYTVTVDHVIHESLTSREITVVSSDGMVRLHLVSRGTSGDNPFIKEDPRGVLTLGYTNVVTGSNCFVTLCGEFEITYNFQKGPYA